MKKSNVITSVAVNKIKTLYIVRGLPGSGKTTLAHILAGDNPTLVCEADQYFTDPVTGVYNFNREELRDAHSYCQHKASLLMSKGEERVIVSNTSTTLKEIIPYLNEALHYKYKVKVLDCHGFFGNHRDVPEKVMKAMKERWEPFSEVKLPAKYNDNM